MGQVGKRYNAEERITLLEQGRGMLAGGLSIEEAIKELGITRDSWDAWMRWDEAGRPDTIPPREATRAAEAPRTARQAAPAQKARMTTDTRSVTDYESIIVDLLFQIRELQWMLGSQGDQGEAP